MRIDGTAIAQSITQGLKKRIEILKQKGITPKVAIVLVGNDPASVSYVGRKEKKMTEIGGIAEVIRKDENISQDELLSLVEKLNKDVTVYGIVVQRPLPKYIDGEVVSEVTNPEKDVDGFHPNSPFDMPLGNAVIKVMEEIYRQAQRMASKTGLSADSAFVATSAKEAALAKAESRAKFIAWLQSKNIVVIGKGKTGGFPTIKTLRNMGIEPVIIDSKTENRKELLQKADIVVSAVGKPNALEPTWLKKGVILVNVGMHREKDGRLHGDYEENNVQDIASFYTPTPGGVGPVNVSCLLENLVLAAENR